MITSKEALEEIIEYIKYKRKDEHIPFFLQLYIDDIKKDLERLEQLEKVIEILKKKKPNLFTYFRNKKIYTESFVNRDLTQEEYELLKEYLDEKKD